MPTVINGVGTWYYGRDRIHTVRGVCENCHAAGDLTSYDTTNYFTFLFVPIIPLGKKRILQQCGRCRKHRVIKLRDWEAAKAKDSAAVLGKFRANADDREAVLHALSLATAYQDQGLFDRVAETLANHRNDDAELQTLLGQGFEYFSRHAEAESAYRRALLAGDSPAGREQLGMNLLKQGRPEEAEPCFAACYESAQGAGTLYWLVAAYQARGGHEDALRVIDAAFAKWPALASDKAWRKLQHVSTKYRTSDKRVATPLLGTSASAGYREGGWRAKAPRYVLPSLLAAAFLVYLGIAIYLGHSRTVYLLNGAPVPYTVSVNGVEQSLAPGRPIPVSLGEGEVTVSLKGPGPPAEERKCRIETSFWTRPFSDRTFVINPDRVAVLLREVTVYSAQPTHSDEPDGYYTGQLLHEFANVDYVFAQFPPSINVKGTERQKKTRIDLFPAPDAETRLRIALDGRPLPEAHDYARQWLYFQPDDAATLLWLVTQLDPASAVTFLSPRLADRPVRTEWHRAYQVVMERGEPERDLIPEYRALVAATRRAPDAVYLLARLCPRDECVKLLAEAAGANPPSHLAENALGYHALAEGRFSDAAKWCRKAVTGAPGHLLIERQYDQALWAARAYDELMALSVAKLAAHPDALSELLRQMKIQLARGQRGIAQSTFNQLLNHLGAAAAGQRRVLASAFDICEALVKRDPDAFLKATDGAGQADAFVQAVLRDQPQTAADSLREARAHGNGVHYGLLYLCAQRLGMPAVADEALSKYIAELRHASRDERAFAELLAGPGPTSAQTKLLGMEVSAKRVAVAVAMRKFPSLRSELAPFAVKLNFDFDVEGLCLSRELSR